MYGRQPHPARNRNLPRQDRPLFIAAMVTVIVLNGVCAFILPRYVGSWSWAKGNVHFISSLIAAPIVVPAGVLLFVLGRLIRKSRRSP